MGLAFTVDSPLKVARFGISSAVSLCDDTLLEQMRRHYCGEYGLPFAPIHPSAHDYRALRITAYLNLLDSLTRQQFEQLRNEAFAPGSEICRYFELLPESSSLYRAYRRMLAEPEGEERQRQQAWLRGQMRLGSIDVNIMTKVDKANYSKGGELLPQEYSDALAALRGYATSSLSGSSLIFSAGLNPRLYSYLEQFAAFLPDAAGTLAKKVVIKVSDYRSAAIQGRFLAKKGIWVSEFRIESGLNCGGHAFATEGLLMGPILEEFKANRQALAAELYAMVQQVLQAKGVPLPEQAPEQRLTVQGGLGTAGEQAFLQAYYQVDATGWGTPFLLVPEATTVDEPTLQKLVKAEKKDLYLSPISPLGVPFNSLRDCSATLEREERIRKGAPGSPCIKKHLVSNTEFTEQPICTASQEYQSRKIEELDKQQLAPAAHQQAFDAITARECLCVGLANSALMIHKLVKKTKAVSICPGPNLAYFSRIFSLEELVGHIYGKINVLKGVQRPSVFVNELQLYIDYLEKQLSTSLAGATAKQLKSLASFKANLLEGIEYYMDLAPAFSAYAEPASNMLEELKGLKQRVFGLQVQEGALV
ncbi:hypothetical protein ADICEAN_02608 [Cesiribacter andamanensis AMV16]|uniref:Uncharacterized protein n=2 Tax=Cesiribacter TaxID=1133570 RepID=M7NKH9_9BACT|nr:hypothetical protein ADICEAN_02608 [Cesiribacter andamanensis AMV16]